MTSHFHFWNNRKIEIIVGGELSEKPKMMAATILTGSILGLGASYSTSIEPVHAAKVKAVHAKTYQQGAMKKLKMIYHEAFKGQMPFAARDER
jgi:hypothetical protein